MAQKCAKFGRSSAALAIGPLTDKLGDLKLKKPAGEALGMFAEKTSLGFVFSQGKYWGGHFLGAQVNIPTHSIRADDQTKGTQSSSGRIDLGQASNSRIWHRRTGTEGISRVLEDRVAKCKWRGKVQCDVDIGNTAALRWNWYVDHNQPVHSC